MTILNVVWSTGRVGIGSHLRMAGCGYGFEEDQEISQAVLFLASDESSYITASTFLVDGGTSAAYLTPE